MKQKLIFKIKDLEKQIKECSKDEENFKFKIIDTLKNEIENLNGKIKIIDFVENNKTCNLPKELYNFLDENQALYLANLKALQLEKFKLFSLYNKIDEVIKKFNGKVFNVKLANYLKTMFISEEKSSNDFWIYISNPSYDKNIYINFGYNRESIGYKYNKSTDYTNYKTNNIRTVSIAFNLNDNRINFDDLKENCKKELERLENNILENERLFNNYYNNINSLEKAKEEIKILLNNYKFDSLEDKKELIEFIQYKCLK